MLQLSTLDALEGDVNLLFLGGAESIGASCALVEIDGRRWIVDCGVRLKGPAVERLPDLGAVEPLGPPSAILVTHAHLDHIGALPVLHQRFPRTPVFATPPTIDLTRIQLLDSLRIMGEEATVDGELPLYSAEAVESLLAMMVPVTPLRPFQPDPGGPEVRFFPAGHILGACSVGITAREESLFLSGDISLDNQRTIPGMRTPRFRATVAVFESTYGNRLHPQRAAEEERLVQAVTETVAAGGKVLIPAFAIGRAQEVIQILLRAQLLGHVPEFPIFVDGMVRRACGVYASHPWYLQSTLRRRVEKHGDPFFGVSDTVRPVRDASERRKIIDGGPCAIVSSSGMLAGGPSPLYAAALAEGERNLIAITGYQDEEAPGRQLQEAARGERETITLEGREVRPRCRVTTYGLSGHASGAQIAAMARAVGAADVLLVHGDGESRRELAGLFLRERVGRVHLPAHGEPVAPRGRRRPRGPGGRLDDLRRRLRINGVLGRAPAPPETVTEEALERLAAHVRESYPEGASFSAEELYYAAFGSLPREEEALGRFEDALRASSRFTPHPSRLFHFTAAAPEDEEGRAQGALQELLRRVDEALPPEVGLLRKSYQPGSRHLTLVFAFPDVAGPRCRAALEEIFVGTEWTWEIHPFPNSQELERLLREKLPDPRRLARNPSILLEERRVLVHIDRGLAGEEEPRWAEAAARIRERTGFAVEFKEHAGTPPAREERDERGRLEVNRAYAAIREAFRAEPHQVYRCGRKPAAAGGEEWIEVTFISPQVGNRYREKLERLEEETGWRLRPSPVPNTHAILQAARTHLEGYALRKGPSLQPGEARVQVALAERLEPEVRERIQEIQVTFREATGFELTFRDPAAKDLSV